MTNDPIEELRKLSPFAAGPGDSVEPLEAKSALFEETIMQTVEPTKGGRAVPAPAAGPTRRPLWRRPLTAIPAMAGVLAMVVIGVFVFSAVTAPSALAAVTAAAERTDDLKSGVATIVIEAREVGGVPGSQFTARATYRYQDDDYAFVYEVSASEAESGMFEVRRVDGAEYWRSGGSESWFVPAQQDPSLEIDIPGSLGFTGESIDASALLDLISLADDVIEVDTANGTTTYEGTVATSDLVALGADDLPMGLSAVLSGPSPEAELPDTLGVKVATTDGLLSSATLLVNGETASAGFADATLTTTYTELGLPQTITSPAADEVEELPAIDFGAIEEQVAVLDELETRRPGLCEEVETQYLGTEAAPIEIDQAGLEAFVSAMAQCYTEAGEPAAAEAFLGLMGEIVPFE